MHARTLGRRLVPLVTLLLLSPALAMWAMPTDAPVDRLVTNLTAYTAEHPDDAQGHYILGRVHGLAFTLKSRTVSVWDPRMRESSKPLPDVCTDDFQSAGWRQPPAGTDSKAMTQQELVDHLAASITPFEKAIALDAKPALYHLGLAYVLETGAMLAEKCAALPGAPAAPLSDQEKSEFEALVAKLADSSEAVRAEALKRLRERLPRAVLIIHAHRADTDPNAATAIHELLAAHWRERAIAHYDAAFERAITEDIKIKEKPLRGLRELVGYEAGIAYIRLMTSRGPASAAERERLAKVKADIDTLEKKPHSGIVTPVVFAIDRPAPLAELLAAGRTAVFDLDGDGSPEAWPWVKPDTGILVWDPAGKGTITSGRQLFGSVTWWLFFSDGYRALDALDDNRDGELAGNELRGLSVWFDRNGNGISEPGEVLPVCSLGIAGISARATSCEGESPSNPAGLRMSDGRILPTYDWVTEPAPAAPPAHAPAPQ